MQRLILAIVLTLACVSSSRLAAQAVRTDEVQPGARVRIVAPGIVAGRYVGTVLSRSADTITVGSSNSLPIALPTTRIESLEISRGKSRADGAIRGIKWGAPIGAVLGLAFIAAINDDCYECGFSSDSKAGFVALETLGGAMWGAGIGALVGRERWQSFDLQRRSALGIGPHGPTLALRLEF